MSLDVEHTKARLSEIRKQMDLVRSFGISIGPSTPWELITIAVGLVAAVERVQALHTPDEFGMCEGCGDNEHGYAIVPHPCPTIRELETP
ncbi:hypothetical protein ACIQYW_14045 [Rhodococcus erythropolis]|uniref:hypothetical protein n=1 Tax=Rhodococcus baikonurensis TaxID=172041 RepID=UPI003395225F